MADRSGGWIGGVRLIPFRPVSRVIVHLLPGTKKALDACRLVEGLYLAGRRVLVWLADERKAKMFDDYLWTFADEAFVPHVFCRGAGEVEEPVVVVAGQLQPVGQAEVLVLLDPPEDLASAKSFEEVHDFVTAAPADADRAEAWRAAGFEVIEQRGVGVGHPLRR